MSTKIYYAYRTKRGVDKWQVIKEIRRRALDRAKARLREMITLICTREDVQESIRKSLEDTKNLFPGLRGVKDVVSFGEASRYIGDQFRKQATEMIRNPWDLAVSFTVRHRAGRFYIIPYSGEGMHNVFGFLAEMDELEEYGYWNNTDKPEHVSEAAWNWRAKIWNDFCDEWDDYLCVEVLTPMNYIYKSPWLEMCREEAEKGKEESLV